MIGSAGTGKSCLLHQFIENKCKSRVPKTKLVVVRSATLKIRRLKTNWGIEQQVGRPLVGLFHQLGCLNRSCRSFLLVGCTSERREMERLLQFVNHLLECLGTGDL